MKCVGNTADTTKGEVTYTSIEIDFPKGYNKDNCVVIAIGRKNFSDDRGYAYADTGVPDATDLVIGTEPTRVALGSRTNNTKIYIAMGNFATSEKTVYYRIVLMKLPEISTSEYKLGDVNGDGQITQADLTLVQNYIQGTQALTDKQLKAADVNKDGSINTGDTLKLSQYINGAISSF